MPTTRIAVVGVHGYGRHHVAAVQAAPWARLVGVCDVQRPPPEAGDVAWFARIDDLLTDTAPDIVVIATPIDTHATLAERALYADADVYLEKPPVGSRADFDRLSQAVRSSGRSCQVGFQAHGSDAIDRAKSIVASGRIGRLQGIAATGTWQRTRGYYERATWAGRRVMDGRPVVDGVATNPLGHAVALALRLDDSDRTGDLTDIRPELFHANDIEADDTAAIRITTTRGTPIVVALTLCAEKEREPAVTLHGETGTVVVRYKSHVIDLVDDAGTTRETHASRDLLWDLADHRAERSRPLVSPLERAGAFTDVLEAIRVAPDPVAIPKRFVHRVGDGSESRMVIDGIDAVIGRAGQDLATFTELDVPWARTPAATSGQPTSGQPTSGQPMSGQPMSGQPMSGETMSGETVPGGPA